MGAHDVAQVSSCCVSSRETRLSTKRSRCRLHGAPELIAEEVASRGCSSVAAARLEAIKTFLITQVDAERRRLGGLSPIDETTALLSIHVEILMNNMRLRFELGSSGWLAPGKTLVIRGLIWASMLYAIVYAFLVVSVFGARWLGMPSAADYVIGIGLPIFGFVFYALVVSVGEHRTAKEIKFCVSSIHDIAIGLLVGSSVLAVMLLFLDGLGLYTVRFGHWHGWFDSLVFDSYISGMLEELAFRAILLRVFARIFNPLIGLVLSSALFGLAHLTHATVFQAVEVAFNAGLTMGLAYMFTGRIWMSVGMHIGWDFTEESLFGVNTHQGLLVSVPNPLEPVLITGGAYGPDGSVFAGLVGAVAIVAMFYAYRRGWYGERPATLMSW